jgi:hypothetical protein
MHVPAWLIFLCVPVAYLAVMRWVLPKLGVPT